MAQAEDIILIGGSAGSYGVIVNMLESIPAKISSAIIVIIHRNAKYPTQMEKSLTLKLKRPILSAEDKVTIEGNNIYFASPGYHLLVEPDHTFSLDISDPVNFSRPSIDVLFESAAEVYTTRCTALLLSGANNDGAYGIKRVEFFGGTSIIQDPNDALINTMPNSAITTSSKANVLKNKEIINYFCSIK
ncbi:chemotaxis protein CheB [Sphingobacterium pedocola]|uniref:protein-glutamate methylesterase n=1 Tax=Sphingobacterium pedocola TaxID=2082722 RepID=A0ABR9T4A8_9SPHI|nr:chemotaxis protein CheB [Sphingobacterium pedocola]MBE8720115.1 chemotaxis protein CheB [Sphingobacterium pedocola]